jgi:hypothetical protein
MGQCSARQGGVRNKIKPCNQGQGQGQGATFLFSSSLISREDENKMRQSNRPCPKVDK